MKNWIDTCDVRIQLYWECTNSTLPSIVLDTIWFKCIVVNQIYSSVKTHRVTMTVKPYLFLEHCIQMHLTSSEKNNFFQIIWWYFLLPRLKLEKFKIYLILKQNKIHHLFIEVAAAVILGRNRFLKKLVYSGNQK